MTSKARQGSFEDLINEVSPTNNPEVKNTAWKLREIILKDFPEATEVVRLGDGAASYGFGPKKMSESHVYIMPRSEYVNLGFWHGTSIKDPDNLLEGTGKKMRHVKVHSVKEAQSPALAKLIAFALAERKAELGL